MVDLKISGFGGSLEVKRVLGLWILGQGMSKTWSESLKSDILASCETLGCTKSGPSSVPDHVIYTRNISGVSDFGVLEGFGGGFGAKIERAVRVHKRLHRCFEKRILKIELQNFCQISSNLDFCRGLEFSFFWVSKICGLATLSGFDFGLEGGAWTAKIYLLKNSNVCVIARMEGPMCRSWNLSQWVVKFCPRSPKRVAKK